MFGVTMTPIQIWFLITSHIIFGVWCNVLMQHFFKRAFGILEKSDKICIFLVSCFGIVGFISFGIVAWVFKRRIK